MIYVIGLGPGGRDEMTPRAVAALDRCDIILGYKIYIDLIAPLYNKNEKNNKDLHPSSMRQESERCKEALKLALENPDKNIGVISSGDPGVYGMAGLMLETANGQVEVEIVPGITAANSAAAVLGAPLMHDFAIISLSDLLTPQDLIEKRLNAAAEADFVICIYNPASHGRPQHFERACDILLRHKSPDTPAGWVSNISRSGETHKIMTLGEIRNEKLDMFCTAIIGNSETKIKNNLMITPRGYFEKNN